MKKVTILTILISLLFVSAAVALDIQELAGAWRRLIEHPDQCGTMLYQIEVAGTKTLYVKFVQNIPGSDSTCSNLTVREVFDLTLEGSNLSGMWERRTRAWGPFPADRESGTATGFIYAGGKRITLQTPKYTVTFERWD